MSIKNICMLSTHGYFDPVPELGRTDTGGQVVYVLKLSQALSRRGINVDIYTRWFEREKPQIEEVPNCNNVRIIRINAGDWTFIRKEDIYDVLPELALNMINFIEERNIDYDVFHGHYVDAGIVTIHLAKYFKRPSFFTAHSLGAWKRERMEGDDREMEKRYRFKRRIKEEIDIFNSVRAQTVTTLIQKEKLRDLYKFSGDNVTVIPPGVDINRFHPLNREDIEINVKLPDRYIFCLSRIDTNKGHDMLLYAFDELRKKVKDVKLLIGGGSKKPEKREREVLDMIQSTIHRRKLEGSVQIIGYVPDELLNVYYALAELFVLPSIFEPFGMTAIEAMACGTPVIASKFGGIRNVITSEKNGLLIDPSNKLEFSDAMVRLLKDREFSQKIGTEGYRNVYASYSWEAIADKHLIFYGKFMKKD